MIGDNSLSPQVYNNIGQAWHRTLIEIHFYGERRKPRDEPIRDLHNVAFTVPALNNVLVNAERDLNYRFMVAEWLWIWFGRYDVASIAQYNSKIAPFSDDGQTFAGAYGPHFTSQWDRVYRKLRDDPDTRQAVFRIFPELSREPTKDVPCTLTMQLFNVSDRLDATVTMRSSDTWLGLPYDFFNFSMLLNTMATQLNLEVGFLTMQLGSSHLYERDIDAAQRAIEVESSHLTSKPLSHSPPDWLETTLVHRVETTGSGHLFPWSRYERALLAPNRVDAYHQLLAIHEGR